MELNCCEGEDEETHNRLHGYMTADMLRVVLPLVDYIRI